MLPLFTRMINIIISHRLLSITQILDGTSNITEELLDQDILRIIRKQATTTTERYKTPKADTGILLNGVRTYSYRDTESIRFGVLERIRVNTQGRVMQNHLLYWLIKFLTKQSSSCWSGCRKHYR